MNLAAHNLLQDKTRARLRVEGITKRFGTGKTEVVAVRGVSLDVKRGEVVLITGPSGSGKTTLLLMLGALLKPTEGEIQLDSDVISALRENRLPEIRLRRVGFVFQHFNLLSSLSALENVAIVAELAGMKAGSARQKAEQLLGGLGLGKRLGFFPEKLSGGEKQRVSIARALVNDPTLVLADEPTANLRPSTSARAAARRSPWSTRRRSWRLRCRPLHHWRCIKHDQPESKPIPMGGILNRCQATSRTKLKYRVV